MQTSQKLSLDGASQLFRGPETKEIKWAESVSSATIVIVTRSSGKGEEWSVRLADDSESEKHQCEDDDCYVKLERLHLDSPDFLWEPAERHLCIKNLDGTWDTHRLTPGSVCTGVITLRNMQGHYSIESNHGRSDKLEMRFSPLTDRSQVDDYQKAIRQCANRASEKLFTSSDPQTLQDHFETAMTEYVAEEGNPGWTAQLGEDDGFVFKSTAVPYRGVDLHFCDDDLDSV